MELSPKTNKLFDMMMQVPPNLEAIRAELEAGQYPSEALSAAVTRYAERCFDEGGRAGSCRRGPI